MAMKLLFVVLLGVFLSGCATKAYRGVEHECSPAAFNDYPVVNVRTIETRQRWVDVATGARSCFTTKEGNQTHTICTEITRPELITYQEIVIVDQNQAIRDKAIQACSKNLCLQRYGNAECKTDEVLVPVQ
jgi:hypothetical protein